MSHRSDFPYHELSVEERLLLVEEIWDSIAAKGESVPSAQGEQFDRAFTCDAEQGGVPVIS